MPEFFSNTIQAHVARYCARLGVYEYLAVKRAAYLKIYPGVWQTITGTIESGESSINTAVRELKEETGLDYLKMWSVPYTASFYVHKKDYISAAPVFGFLAKEDCSVILSKEHDEYIWAEYDECMQFMELPTHKEGLRIFREFVLDYSKNDLFLISETHE